MRSAVSMLPSIDETDHSCRCGSCFTRKPCRCSIPSARADYGVVTVANRKFIGLITNSLDMTMRFQYKIGSVGLIKSIRELGCLYGV